MIAKRRENHRSEERVEKDLHGSLKHLFLRSTPNIYIYICLSLGRLYEAKYTGEAASTKSQQFEAGAKASTATTSLRNGPATSKHS